jgi:hypothetical protein
MTDFSVGDCVIDVDADHEKTLVVVGIPGLTASEWTVYETDEGKVTVADDNLNYPDHASVVLASFLNDDRHDMSITDLDEWRDSEKLFQRVCNKGVVFYAFPEGRLELFKDTATDEGGNQVTSE